MKKIMQIIDFACPIAVLFAIPFLSFKTFWIEEWPAATQAATLAAAIVAGIVSILGIILKFIFDYKSNRTAYARKISENMISKLHTYAEKYYLPLMHYAEFSSYQLKKILTNAKASTQEKQFALFSVTRYLQYGLKLSSERGGIVFLKSFDSELYLKKLHLRAIHNLELSTVQICRLQKSITLEETFLDFLKKIQGDSELRQIYETFEKWLKNDNNKVKKAITYFRCYSEFMRHELNSIYRPWYQRKAPQISRECKKVLHIFKKLKGKKGKEKISKNKYEEKKEEEKNLSDSISGFFEEGRI